MLALIHFAHILLGTVWLGGTLVLSLAFYPALARLQAADAKRVFDAVAALAAPLIGAAGGLTLLIGPLRAVIGRGFTGFADPYAHMVATSFVLVLAAQIIDGRFRKRFSTLMADPAAFASRAAPMARRNAWVGAVLMLLVLALMVAMGLALY